MAFTSAFTHQHAQSKEDDFLMQRAVTFSLYGNTSHMAMVSNNSNSTNYYGSSNTSPPPTPEFRTQKSIPIPHFPGHDQSHPIKVQNNKSIETNMFKYQQSRPLNESDDNETPPVSDINNNNYKALPITDFDRQSKFNPDTQMFDRQQTLSNVSYYDHDPLSLAALSPNNINNITNTSLPMAHINENSTSYDNNMNMNNINNRPITTPMIIHAESMTENIPYPLEMKTNYSTVTNLQYNNHLNNNNKPALTLAQFSNDIRAYDTWMACCDIHDDSFAYYSALYPILCEVFAQDTTCARVPLQSELQSVMLAHGAKKYDTRHLAYHSKSTKLTPTASGSSRLRMYQNNNEYSKSTTNGSEIIIMDGDSDAGSVSVPRITPPPSPHNMNMENMAHVNHNPSHMSFDFDNPTIIPKHYITITHKKFIKFWKWFLECSQIVKELKHLWEVTDYCQMQCNLFCTRDECQRILETSPQGTFLLRLSNVIKGGLVLSYCEPTYRNRKSKGIKFKHTILIRKKDNQYVVQRKGKNRKKKVDASKTRQQLTTISSVVRSFVKIKFLYTPKCLYPKKNVF